MIELVPIESLRPHEKFIAPYPYLNFSLFELLPPPFEGWDLYLEEHNFVPHEHVDTITKQPIEACNLALVRILDHFGNVLQEDDIIDKRILIIPVRTT